MVLVRRRVQAKTQGMKQNNSPPWLPGQGTTVVVVSDSPALQGEVGRVCAAAAVGLAVAETVEASVELWNGAAAILIGSDARGALAGWRGPTIVVGPATDAEQMWRQASLLSADRVAVLPESAQWLANYLTRLHEPAVHSGVIGVLGGCGGAGASTLAALLAAGAAARGQESLLIDGDEWGGGLDLAIGMQDLPGLRWRDLLNASGAINPAQLAASLPRAHGISLLAWRIGAFDVPATGIGAAIAEVLKASSEAFETVVVDLSRSADGVSNLAGYCDSYVVVVPAKARATAAAGALMAALPSVPVGVVVRGPVGEGVDASMVADSLGHPCLGVYPTLRRLRDLPEPGRLGEMIRVRKLRFLIEGILGWADRENASPHRGAGEGGRN